MRKILQQLLSLFNLKVVRATSDVVVDSEFGEIYDVCRRYTMTSKERMYALYKAVEYIARSGIPGDFVECGVWRGGSSMLIALTLLKFGIRDRRLYLYDTYKGMIEPSQEDEDIYGRRSVHRIWKKGNRVEYNSWCYASLDDVKKNMEETKYPLDRICFVEGKVEDTIPESMPSQIALLRLDTDWYDSTKHELQHMYPLIPEGGILLVDDYGCWAGAKKAVDEYFMTQPPILLNRIDLAGRIGLKTTAYRSTNN